MSVILFLSLSLSPPGLCTVVQMKIWKKESEAGPLFVCKVERVCVCVFCVYVLTLYIA